MVFSKIFRLKLERLYFYFHSMLIIASKKETSFDMQYYIACILLWCNIYGGSQLENKLQVKHRFDYNIQRLSYGLVSNVVNMEGRTSLDMFYVSKRVHVYPL